MTVDGEPASVISNDETLSSGGGLGGKTEVSNFCNTASEVGVISPLACPLGVLGRFNTPVLSEMLSEGTFIRREILTLGALINQQHLRQILTPDTKFDNCHANLVPGSFRRINPRWWTSRHLEKQRRENPGNETSAE